MIKLSKVFILKDNQKSVVAILFYKYLNVDIGRL